MPTKKRPIEEMADYMGKVILVRNLSYLFSVGTKRIEVSSLAIRFFSQQSIKNV